MNRRIFLFCFLIVSIAIGSFTATAISSLATYWHIPYAITGEVYVENITSEDWGNQTPTEWCVALRGGIGCLTLNASNTNMMNYSIYNVTQLNVTSAYIQNYVLENGTSYNLTELIGGGSSSSSFVYADYFNQSLNTTDDIMFNDLKLTGTINNLSDSVSIDPNNRYLFDGSNIAVHYGDRYLLDPTGMNEELSWNNYLQFPNGVYDSVPAMCIDTNNRILYAPDGFTPQINWDDTGASAAAIYFWNGAFIVGNIIGDSFSGLPSIDTNNRILYASDGSSSLIDWSGTHSGIAYIDFDNVNNAIYANSLLVGSFYDTSFYKSVDGNSRILYAEDGSTEMLEWTSAGVQVSNAYLLPTTDGLDGQVLTTDGAGIVSWENASGGTGDTHQYTISRPDSRETVMTWVI